MSLLQQIAGQEASLEQIMAGREERAERQKALLQIHQDQTELCLLSFGLNIAGPIKCFSLAKRTFEAGKTLISLELSSRNIATVSHEDGSNLAGFIYFYVLACSAQKVKEIFSLLEDTHPLGRLFDLDVLDSQGQPFSRQALSLPPRTCLLCSNEAHLCARSREHSLSAIQQETVRIMADYFIEQDADHIAAMAVRSLLYEVSVTPKPGLVDMNNNGSHTDMNFFTFLDSSSVLARHFRLFAREGLQNPTLPPEVLFERLRMLGKSAERDMFAATGGVNTHKGLIFSLGILCGVLGQLKALGQGSEQAEVAQWTVDAVLERFAQTAKPVLADFKAVEIEAATEQKTTGEQLYVRYGTTGIRGEAAAGFPAVRNYSLPLLITLLEQGYSFNQAGALTLADLVLRLEDTNLIKRCGLEGKKEIQQKVRACLESCDRENLTAQLLELDQFFIERHASPGGAADLLAITFMLYFITLDKSGR